MEGAPYVVYVKNFPQGLDLICATLSTAALSLQTVLTSPDEFHLYNDQVSRWDLTPVAFSTWASCPSLPDDTILVTCERLGKTHLVSARELGIGCVMSTKGFRDHPQD